MRASTARTMPQKAPNRQTKQMMATTDRLFQPETQTTKRPLPRRMPRVVSLVAA
jgi:hypothetical protein